MQGLGGRRRQGREALGGKGWQRNLDDWNYCCHLWEAPVSHLDQEMVRSCSQDFDPSSPVVAQLFVCAGAPADVQARPVCVGTSNHKARKQVRPFLEPSSCVYLLSGAPRGSCGWWSSPCRLRTIRRSQVSHWRRAPLHWPLSSPPSSRPPPSSPCHCAPGKYGLATTDSWHTCVFYC